jgi:predicted RecA/RadA family phage recombinase
MNVIFKQRGEAIDYTPTADVASGDVVVQGELVGVAKLDIKAGNLGALAVTGVFDFPKATGAGSTMAAGVKAYWDEAAKVATEDAASGANKYLGKTVAEAGDEAATVRVRLSQ